MEYDPPIRQSATDYRLTSIVDQISGQPTLYRANIASNLSLVRDTPFVGHRDDYHPRVAPHARRNQH
ncbi:hypothetical protein Y032_0030g2016 [Ancylostoma ceylanicum]|uniref:Uncharacterized protein n=1 Tax=Ancylostoma ceylanicum TaxID=53326 RepID=A0A016URC6_9BILA|nr:hypothetical protein Y032_0030g2016 [Ancylostoma ceylanicum]